MDDRETVLVKKLQDLLTQAAETSVELSRADGTVEGVPHYSVIELHAHEVGQQLARRIQQQQMTEIAAAGIRKHACPACGARCEVARQSREVTSVDGRLELPELAAHCHKCRRSFFPESSCVGV